MNIDKVIEEFQQEFCTLYDTPVVVRGVLENEGYLALLEDNGSKVSNWFRTKLEEAYDKGRLDGYFAKQLENETLDKQLSKAIKDEFSSVGKMSYDHDDEIEARKQAGEKPFDKEN